MSSPMRLVIAIACIQGYSCQEVINASVVSSMEAFYEDYEISGKVVKFTGVEPLWINGSTETIQQASGPLEAGLLSKLIVPRFLVNDYLLRAFAKQGESVPAPYVIVGTPSQEDFLCPAPSHGWYSIVEGSIAVEVNATRLEMNSHEALFLPAGTSIAIKASERSKMLRFCFVDASNLARLRKVLMTETESKYYPALKYIDATDTAMEREPLAQLWSNLAKWPQTKRTRRGKQSLNTWRLENQWRWRVVAATIPELSPPIILEATHELMLLRFETDYSTPPGDDTSLGIKIEYNSTGISDEAAPETALDQVARYGTGALSGEAYFSLLDRDGKRISYALKDNAQQSPIHNLQPGHIYIFRIRIKYGDAYGPYSEWSQGIATRLRGPPHGMHLPLSIKPADDASVLELEIGPPSDDGGDPIRGILVRYRHIDSETMRLEWLSAGSHPPNTLISVHGLLPNRCDNIDNNTHADTSHAYIFQAAAYNRLGLSEWSRPSEPVRTGCTPQTTVKGRGVQRKFVHHHLEKDEVDTDFWAPAHAAITSAINTLHESHISLRLGPIATLSNGKLQIWSHEFYGQPLRPPLYRCEAWFSHWSPPQISVAAELVRAQPPLANATLQPELYHRIAIAHRGDVPFVVKAKYAQRVGALALIVADDGQCGDSLDQYCVPGADRSRGEGFAALDNPQRWSSVHIPVILILKKDADEVFRHLDDEVYNIPLSSSSLHDEL